MRTRNIVLLAVLAVVAVLFGIGVGSIFEDNLASNILVMQSPVAGDLTVYTTAGMKWQGFGTPTVYLKREQFSFSSKKNQGKSHDESLKVQFAEGGTAQVSGVISWEMPMDTKNVLALHTLYGSQSAVEQQLVRPAIERALYMTGTLMTSSEAYAARKADFLKHFENQVRNGNYETETVSEKRPDPVTGVDKTVQTVRIVLDKAGFPIRASESPLKQFGILVLPPAIDDIAWEPIVKQQIAQQQQAITQVQTAQAKAREAEQEAITAAKNGEAQAAKAKWEQEVIKAKEVTAAEQRKRVAELDAQAAEQNKRRNVLDGEGEAAKRALIMNADGGLDRKTDAVVKINQIWADAFARYQGKIVPEVVMGSSGQSGGNNAAMDLMNLIGIKAAREMAVDLSNTGKERTNKQGK